MKFNSDDSSPLRNLIEINLWFIPKNSPKHLLLEIFQKIGQENSVVKYKIWYTLYTG